MGNILKKMKLATAVLLLSFVAYTFQGNCLKASMCQSCNTTTSLCSACSGLSTFKGGARYLNSGVCSVAGAAQKPTVGSAHLANMMGTTRATASYTGSNMFVCKSGYYAYIDEVTTNLSGCYASSGVASAPLSNITGNPVTANGTYVVGVKTSTTTYWNLLMCTGGKRPDSAANAFKNCTGTSGITNCDSGVYASTSATAETCAACKSGYVLKSDATACLTATTALANCQQADTAGTACATCDSTSYMGGKGVCVKTAFLKVMSIMGIALLALLQ